MYPQLFHLCYTVRTSFMENGCSVLNVYSHNKIRAIVKTHLDGQPFVLKAQRGKETETMSFIFRNTCSQSLLINWPLERVTVKALSSLWQSCLVGGNIHGVPKRSREEGLRRLPGPVALSSGQARFGLCSPVTPTIGSDISNCQSESKVKTACDIWEISFRQSVRPWSPV